MTSLSQQYAVSSSVRVMRRRAAWMDVCLLALAFSVLVNDAGAASGELRWSRDTGARVAAAGALVPVDLDGDGQAERRCLIVGNSDGEVYAFDARTKDDCWEPQRIGSSDDLEGADGGRLSGPPADLRIAPVALPGLAATVFAVPDGRVVALDNATGAIRWNTALHEDIEAPPTVTLDGTVIIGTRRGRIHRLDGVSGERIGSPIGVAGAVHHNTVALPTGGGIVTTQSFPHGIVELGSLMREDAAEQALFEADLLPRAAPVVDQEGRTIFALGEKLYVRAPAGEMDDGEPRQVGGLPEGLALTPDGRTVWVASRTTVGGGGMLQAFGLDDESTSALAAIVTPSAPTGAPAIGKDGSAYVALRGGVVLGVDATGRELFEYRSDGGEFRAEPVIGAGALFIGDTNGTVYALVLDESAAGTDDAPWPVVGQNAQRTGQELLSDYKLPGEVLERVDTVGIETIEVTAADPVDEPLLEQMMPGGGQTGVAVAVDAGRFKVAVTRMVATASGRPSTEPVGKPYSTRVYSVPVQRLEIAEPLAVPRNAKVDIPPKIFPAGSQVQTSDRPLIWHSERRTLYAATPGDWRIEWATPDNTPFSVLVSIEWPRDPERVQKTVMGASAVVVTDADFTHAFRWPPEENQGQLTSVEAFEPLATGRSVIVLADGPDPRTAERLAFIAVEALDPVGSPAFQGTRSATIGSPIAYHDDFPGQHQEPNRKPGLLTERARVNVDTGFYDREQRTGEIIPVNLEGPSRNDDLLLAFYQRSTSLLVAGEGDEESAFPGWRDEERFYGSERRRLPAVREQRDVYWPATTARYLPAWPEVGAGPGQARELVIAAPANELLAEAVYGSERDVYGQPDPDQPGYNPNEEHAYPAGDSLWALRSDLNTPETSEPYVLVNYKDPADGRAKMLVVKVVAEDSEHEFVYGATAGDAVLPPPAFRGVTFKMYPHPLDRSLMLEDRTGVWRAYRAGDRGESITVVNHFCYRTLESFDVPPGQSMDCPHPGGEGMYSWLSTYSRRQKLARGEEVVGSAPMDVRYVTRWPASPHTLRPGQTLTMAIDDLPQIHGTHGMKLLYQQSVAQGLGEAVRLLDVASPRTVALEKLPKVLRYPRTDTVDDNVFFPELPPNLRHQLYFDRDDQRLAFRGQYLAGGADGRVLDQPDPGNENSVLMNVMSPRAVAQIKSTLRDALDEVLDDNGTTFGTALDSLAAEAATPILVTDTESDSDHLALVAADTGATGWVSFVVGNSESSAEAPKVEVIYVDGERDRGEVIVLMHSNPFAEEVYVRPLLSHRLSNEGGLNLPCLVE